VAGDFTATINWGDGTTTTGTVSGSGGTLTVSGSHTYPADEGSFAVTVHLADDTPGTATATANITASVLEGDVLTATGVNINALAGTAFNGPVATFRDTFTSNVAGDFTATINWGDGTSSAGTVSGTGGSFTVSGSHTYGTAGNFTVSVKIADDAPGTATASASSNASVNFPPISARLQQQLLLDLFAQPLLGTPEVLQNFQLDFMALFGQAALIGGAGSEATQLISDEIALIFDLRLSALELLGIHSASLQMDISRLEFEISNLPLYNTALGFDLGFFAGALALHSMTSS